MKTATVMEQPEIENSRARDYPRAAHDHPMGRRVSVVGGGGKTTLAKAIARKHGLAFIELDALHWKPNWVEAGAEEFQEKVKAVIPGAQDGWVVDGNYFTKLGGLVEEQADTVVWVNLPWRVMFWRIFWRTIARARDKRRICGDNYESWRKGFFSKDSLLLYHITHRKAYNARGDRFVPWLTPGTPLIELGSPGALREFYLAQGLTRE